MEIYLHEMNQNSKSVLKSNNIWYVSSKYRDRRVTNLIIQDKAEAVKHTQKARNKSFKYVQLQHLP